MKKILTISLALFLTGCQQTPTYHNNHVSMVDKGFIDFIKARYFSEDGWPDQSEQAALVPVQSVDAATFANTDQVTWIGHSTFLVQKNGVNLLTDPIFSDRAAPISGTGPQRFTQPAVTTDQLPKIDIVVISHNHYDHLDKPSIRQLGNTPMYFVPMGLKKWFVDVGISAERVVELAWHQSYQYQQIEITATPSQHWSARGLFDRNKSHWASWLVRFDDYKVWFAGDTGYNDKDFKDIGERYGEIDFAMIPIGAYAPRDFMKTHHVNPEEAVMIHKDVRAKRSLGMHWGAFPLTAEPVLEPVERLEKAANDIDFTAVSVGNQQPLH